jgi:Tfp pilus assembly protein PilX
MMTAKTPRNTQAERRGRGAREKGAGVAEAVMVVLVLMMLAVPFMSRVALNGSPAGTGSEPEAALCLAEAGVEKAVWELNQGAWAGTENISVNLNMAIDGYETPGGAIVGDIDVTLMPFDHAGGTRLVSATGSVRLADASELSKTVTVVLRKGDGYAIASWQEPATEQ